MLQGKITAQGKLLLHGMLVCCEGTTGASFKGKELQVFLFEQNIIFSEAVGKKTQFTNPVYIYKNHIQVKQLVIMSFFCFFFTDVSKFSLETQLKVSPYQEKKAN